MPSLYEGVKAFIRNGHNVHFITCFPPLSYEIKTTNCEREYTKEGIKSYEFSIPLIQMFKKLQCIPLSSNLFLQFFQYPIQMGAEYLVWILFTIGAIAEARKICKKYPPDVVYAYNEMAAISGYVIAKTYRIPNITRLFGTFLHGVLSSRGFWFRYIVAISGYKVPSTYLIVGDDGTKGDQVAEFLDIDKRRLKFWKNGIDFDIYDSTSDLELARTEFAIDKHIKIILSLCRLEKWKGVHRIIEAIPWVVSKRKDVQFVVVGDGTQKRNLEERAKYLRVSEWVRFLGSVDRQKVKKLMNLADIFVTLQDISNLSNVFLEAFVAGRCIVTLNDGSTDGLIINGFSGFFVSNSTPENLAECLLNLLDNDLLRKQVGDNARRMAGKLLESWEERTNKEVALIEDLISSGNLKI